MYNLIEHSDNYQKTFEILWQYYRDEPTFRNVITDFPDENMDSALFKLKQKTAGETGVNGTKDVKIIILLKYLSNFWRTFVKPLINCEINLVLTWSVSVFIVTGVVDGQVPAFAITDIKLYVPVVTLLTHDNPKLLQQLKPSFKRTINWNKYQSKASIQP